MIKTMAQTEEKLRPILDDALETMQSIIDKIFAEHEEYDEDFVKELVQADVIDMLEV